MTLFDKYFCDKSRVLTAEKLQQSFLPKDLGIQMLKSVFFKERT